MTLVSTLAEWAKLHHFGVAVRDFAIPRSFYESMGYRCTSPVIDTVQQVECTMCNARGLPSIELVKPLQEGSPVSRILEQQESAIYHICLEVSDLSNVLQTLRKTHKVVCVKGPAPAPLFEYRSVSFYYVKDVGLFEFLEQNP